MSTTSFELVERDEQRLKDIEAQIAALAAEDASLCDVITAKLAAGQDAAAERGRRSEARQLRADLQEAATLLAQQLVTEREEAGRAAAEARMLAIKRAFGSLQAQYNEDADVLYANAVAYAESIARLNERARALAMLRAEADALSTRFGTPMPTLAPTVVPARHPKALAANEVAQAGFLDSLFIAPDRERDEHGRTRRTYAEVAQSEGFKLIQIAGGPKAWPPLTPKQIEGAAEREAQQAREARELERFGAEVPRSLERRGL